MNVSVTACIVRLVCQTEVAEERRRAVGHATLLPPQPCAHSDHEHDGRSEDRDRDGEIDVQHAGERSMTRRVRTTATREPVAWPALMMIVACSLVASRAEAARAVRYEVDAQIDVASGRVDERVHITLEVGAGEHEIRLWLYADRLAVPPALMEERSARWIYPGEIDRGGVTFERVLVDGAIAETTTVSLGATSSVRSRDAGGSDLVVPIDAGPARTVELVLTATLDVPDRFGRLGHASSRVSLAAPWYPLVLDGEAWQTTAIHAVHVRAVNGLVSLEDGVVGSDRRIERSGSYVPALASAQLRAREGVIDRAHRLVVLEHGDAYVPPPHDAEGVDGLEDVAGVDRFRLLLEAARDAARTAAWLEVPMPETLVVFVVPSRTELAASAPSIAIVSDRIFQIFPLEELRETHRRAARRAIFQVLAQPLSIADSPSDRAFAEDLRAVALQDLDDIRRHGEAQRVDQMLQPFSFHPAVDQLLYAPQVAFEDVYFGSIDEPDPFRDDPMRARLPIVRGRRLLVSITDTLGEDATRRFVAMLVRGRRSVRAALERAMPGSTAHLPTWIAYPTFEVNYRLGEITSEPFTTADGARRWRHTVVVHRDGDVRVEPVEVEVEDERGARVMGRWDGEGAAGVVVIETDGERGTVSIDPRQRLPQSARVADGHPRADDATSQPWRLPLLNNFSIDVLASEANVTGLADITLRQRYDLEHAVVLRLSRTVARTTGRIRYLQGLGPKVHNNRRSMQLGGGLAFSRVEPGFATSVLGGWALELEVLGTLSTQRFVADPRDGVTAIVQLTGGGTLRDDGSIGLTARGSARVSGIVPAGLLNAFFFLAAGGFTIGGALDADRQILGGRYGLRGFANDELVGNGVAFGVIEHRYTLVGDLAINILHGVWAREVQMVTWVGAGGVFDTTRGETARFAGEAGMGLRFHYEYGGVQPGVLALDFGVPVTRLAENGPGSPVAFYLSFDQYF